MSRSSDSLKTDGSWQDASFSEALGPALMRLCATYLTPSSRLGQPELV